MDGIRGLLFGAAVLAAAAGANDASAGTHVNDEVGYRIRMPKDFELRPQAQTSILDEGTIALKDQYVVDSFIDTNTLALSEGYSGYRRSMTTFYFPERSAADIAREQEEARKAMEEKGDGAVLFTGLEGRVFQSFEEYASANIQGFFFEEVRDAKVAGFDAKLFEMKFEKLSMVPQRWMACAYRVPGGEFAVMISCTEQHFKKFKSDSMSTFNSLKLLNEAGLHVDRSPASRVVEGVFEDEDDLTPEELLAKRRKQKEDAFGKCLAALEPGWRNFGTANFLVVYECDPKYAKLASRQAEAVHEWLEESFGTIGDGYVQASILRVFESEEAIPASAGWISFSGKGRVQEIKFGRPTSRGYLSEFDSLNLSVMRHWFSQKNGELWNRMPAWLRMGLEEYVEDANLEGSRLSFGRDQWELDTQNDAVLAQKGFDGDPGLAPLRPIRLLLGMTSDDLFAGQNGRFAKMQCGSFVRYLLDGPGKNSARTKAMLSDYVRNLNALVTEIEQRIEEEAKASLEQTKDRADMTDEERLAAEDDEYRKRRENAYGAVARELLDKAFANTFSAWDDKDWSALDASWRNYLE